MNNQGWSVFHLPPGRRIPDDISTMGPCILPAVAAAEPMPWQRGLFWLLFLGPFFFASYGFANWWAANQATPGAVVFAWERHIPFLAWTILPYWSIDLLYGLSLFLCRTRRETDRHALRLLSAQLISVACFLAFPLAFTFEQPAVSGLFGWMFDVLKGFDRPFNQAPSLHISLLLILWARYAAAVPGRWQWLVHCWALFIGISVLTTYQHHFIDLPTGALAGAFCLWLWPDSDPSPLASPRLTSSPIRRRLALRYLGGALACMAAAALGGYALWLLWPAVSLAVVALNYAVLGANGFQKNDGSLSLGARLLLVPYLVGAWINSRWWTRRHPEPTEIMDGVWLGRMPTAADMARYRFATLLDLSAEMPAPAGKWRYVNVPWLDLVPPNGNQLATAAYQIARLRRKGPVLVCCALGYSRSASAVAAWLLATGRAACVDEALALIAARRTRSVLGTEHKAALASLFQPEGADA